MNTHILEDLGLSNAEARTYLALLSIGTTTSGKLIDKTKLQSSTVYHILGSLMEKGYVSYILKGKTKHFTAADPELFLSDIEDKRDRFQEHLPDLRSLAKIGKEKQTARVYEGVNGLRAAFYDILRTMEKGEEYYFFTAPKSKLFYKQLVLFFQNFHRKRAEAGIRVNGLSTIDSKAIIEEIFADIPLSFIRYHDDFAPTGLVVYKHKIIMWDWDEIPTAIVIESKPMASSYRRFIKERWELAR